MEYQHYLYLKSTDCLSFYPSNSPGSFYSKLPQNFYLRGMWECALLQIQYVNSYFGNTVSPRCFYVCTDICAESVLSESKKPILRRVNNVFQSENVNQTIEADIKNVIYVPIKKEFIDVIHLYIIDDSGTPLVFSTGPLYVTLHLRQVRGF